MRRYTVTIDGRTWTIDVHQTAADRFEIAVGDHRFEATLEEEGDLPGGAISPEILPPEDDRPAPPPRVIAQPAPPSAPSPSGSAAAARLPSAASASQAPAPEASAAPAPAGGAPRTRADVLAAPMPGVVLEVRVAPGAVLRRGDPILVLEAMKMRNTIRAPRDSVVVEVAVEAGRPVGPGDPLVRLGPTGG